LADLVVRIGQVGEASAVAVVQSAGWHYTATAVEVPGVNGPQTRLERDKESAAADEL
jgi:hypothetical protein